MSLLNGSTEAHRSASSQETRHVQPPSNGDDNQRRPESVEEHFLASNHSHYPSASKSWQQRPRSPGLKWHKHYDTPESRRAGRVLVIDYVTKSHSREGMRKVATQEFDNIQGLRKLYTNPERGNEAVLRVFHVQNADWATYFLLRKFNISARDDLVGTDFGYYVKNKRRERRGKPLLSGRSWKTIHDPWRGVSSTSFGLDYLKPYKVRNPELQARRDTTGKMMELSCYDEDDNPTYGWDIYTQRLSCYIQHKEPPANVPGYPGVENPYADNEKNDPHEYFPRLESLDNGNTIIVFENSCSGSIDDTMAAARGQWESRWRRLPFYLASESHDVSNDDRMALECMKIILADIWKSVSESWGCLIDLSNIHVDCLQDRIYEQPADESRAPELWTNASNWLKIERLVTIHSNVVKEMQNYLRELASEPTVEDNWLENSPSDMERIGVLVQEDLVKPTDSLNDLMYKSVEIRDSRHSLQLSTSIYGHEAVLASSSGHRPEKTIRSGAPDPDSNEDDLGTWARCKRTLTRRWTSQLRSTAPVGVTSSSLEEGRGDDLGIISDGVSGVTELLALPATEHAENLPGGMLRLPVSPAAQIRRQRASPRRSSLERPTSKGSSAGRDSGVLIEEEALNWLQELGRRSLDFTDRLGGTPTQRDSTSDSRRNSSEAIAER
ncbi:MAG: hypothetical protein Q9170_001426 [Blastenia crenularia]